MRILVLFLATALAAAGCLADDSGPADPGPGDPPPEPVAQGWAAAALPTRGTDDGHDHGDPAHHKGLSTPNFRILGHDALATAYHGGPSGTYYCGEVKPTEDRTLAVYNSFSSDVALVVVDVTNATDPQLVGELALPFTHTYDAALTDDGRFAVLATSPLDTGPDEGVGVQGAAGSGGPSLATAAGGSTRALQPLWRDACGNESQGPEDTVPYASGVVLVDLRDPTAPAVADYEPQPVIGAHSVYSTTIGGDRFVLASTTNLVHQASVFSFFTVEEAGGAAQLVPYGAFDAQYPAQPNGQPPLVNGHVDGTIQVHPDTGQTLAYLANWDGGMVIVELVAPGVIVPVSVWDGIGGIHETLPLEQKWGDRHITLTGQELVGHPSGRPTGWVVLMDTTDPTAPEPLARWTLPVDVQWDGSLMFSTHYVEMVDETLFVSLYHGGVWAADASQEHWPELPSIGVFIPAEDPENEPASGALAPEVLDVHALPGGELVVLDSHSGAFVLEFDGNYPVAPEGPWEGPAWFSE